MEVETRKNFSFSDILVLERIKFLKEIDSHRRELLLPLHAVFAQQHQSSWVVSYKFPQCVLKITCCGARFLIQRLGQKYHFYRHRISLCGELPGHRHHILLYKCQSQSPYICLRPSWPNSTWKGSPGMPSCILPEGKKPQCLMIENPANV